MRWTPSGFFVVGFFRRWFFHCHILRRGPRRKVSGPGADVVPLRRFSSQLSSSPHFFPGRRFRRRRRRLRRFGWTLLSSRPVCLASSSVSVGPSPKVYRVFPGFPGFRVVTALVVLVVPVLVGAHSCRFLWSSCPSWLSSLLLLTAGFSSRSAFLFQN